MRDAYNSHTVSLRSFVSHGWYNTTFPPIFQPPSHSCKAGAGQGRFARGRHGRFAGGGYSGSTRRG